MDNKEKLAQQESRDDKAAAHAQVRGMGGYRVDPNNIPGRFGESTGHDSVDTIRYINTKQNSPFSTKMEQMSARKMRQLN